jgi:hypothetical protein
MLAGTPTGSAKVQPGRGYDWLKPSGRVIEQRMSAAIGGSNARSRPNSQYPGRTRVAPALLRGLQAEKTVHL